LPFYASRRCDFVFFGRSVSYSLSYLFYFLHDSTHPSCTLLNIVYIYLLLLLLHLITVTITDIVSSMKSSSFTWDDVRSQVRHLRIKTQASFSNHNIWTCKNFCHHPSKHQVFFLSNCIPPNQTSSRQFILYQVDYSILFTNDPGTYNLAKQNK
jgi:hypothetical protein